MDVKIAIYQPHGFAATHFVVFQQVGDMMRVFVPEAQEDGTVTWGWVDYPDDGAPPPPSFVVPKVLEVASGGLLKQIADGLSGMGIWPEGVEAKNEEIKRLEGHLEDLRRLVFEGDWVELQRGRPQAQFVKDGGVEDAKV